MGQLGRQGEGGDTTDDDVVEGPCRSLLPGVDAVSDRSTLHDHDRAMAVPTDRRGRQSRDAAGLFLLEAVVKAESRGLVARIDEHVPVVRHPILARPARCSTLKPGPTDLP